jgi:general nucleoside transport system permease protein
MSVRRIGPVVVQRRALTSRRTLVLFRLGAIALAIAMGTLVFVATGLPVVGSYHSMWSGAFGSLDALAETLVASTPLILTGLAVALAGRMLLWNIGAEGQLYMGATFATAVALWYPSVPRPLLLLLMIVAGAVGGALWALGPGLLRAKLTVNEIITTLMLNYVAILFVDYLVHGRWRDPGSLGFPLSKPFSYNATLPAFFGTRLHAGFVVAGAAGLLLWFVLRGTRWGYEIRLIGESPGTARYAGVPVARNIVLVMLASGALAGIAGMGEVSGIVHRIQPGISASYGYTGIIVATLGRFSPIGVLVAAVLFGALQVGGFSLQALGVPASIVGVLQGVILFITLAAEFLARYGVRWAPGIPIEAIEVERAPEEGLTEPAPMRASGLALGEGEPGEGSH